MKKLLLGVFTLLCFTQIIAQVPQKFQYQVIVRDGSGALIINTPLTLKIEILNGQQSSEYEETHNVTTSDQGLVILVIGSGNTSDNFNDIDWVDGAHFLKVSIDDGLGSGFVVYSNSELLSVPYAIASNSVGNNNIVSILDYGATIYDGPAGGDGTSEDSAAIQKCIDENPGKRIIFPAGQYNITSPIRVREKVDLIGDGRSATIIRPNGCDAFIVTESSVSIKDLWISGDGANNMISGHGVNVRNTSEITLENLRFQDVTIGVELFNTKNTKIDKVDMLYGSESANTIKQGVTIRGESVNNHITNSHITVLDFGINILNSGTDKLEGLMISDTFIWGKINGIRCTGIISLNVSNCIIDLCEGYSIYATNTQGMLLSNNWIADPDSSSSSGNEAIHVETSNDIHITNNNIKTLNGGRAISFTNVNNSSIIGNSIEMRTMANHFVYLDSGAFNNIIKDNTLRHTSQNNPGIENNSTVPNDDTIVKDNITRMN